MATVPPPVFNGTSKYASDFQQVLGRAVAIASLPLQLMQNRLNTFGGQQNAVSGLQTTFSALETSIQSLASAAQGSFSTTVSNPSILQATAASNALPGTYTVEVTAIGSSTTTLSKAGLTTVTDPTADNISAASSYTLTVNGTPQTITPSGTSLVSLANAINDAALGVQATIVNLGSNSSPDYRLAVTSTSLAADTIQLSDDSGGLLDTLSSGSPATYRVNGVANDISSNSTQITLAPGLTVQLLEAAPGQPVKITVTQSNTALNNSLTNFVNAYNAASDAVGQQHGQNAGALSGDSLILSLGQALRSVSQFSAGSGTLASLADLGVTVDKSGHLAFDSSVLNGQSPTAVQQFLGNLTSGGFLQAANSAITAVADPTTGMIESSLTLIQTQISNQNAKISEETNRITDLETTLQQKLAQADAAIAVLQQQVTYMSNLFATMYPNANNSNITGNNNSGG